MHVHVCVCVCVCVFVGVMHKNQILVTGSIWSCEACLPILQIHKRIAKGYLNVQFKEKCSTKVSQDDITSNTKVTSSVCVC